MLRRCQGVMFAPRSTLEIVSSSRVVWQPEQFPAKYKHGMTLWQLLATVAWCSSPGRWIVGRERYWFVLQDTGLFRTRTSRYGMAGSHLDHVARRSGSSHRTRNIRVCVCVCVHVEVCAWFCLNLKRAIFVCIWGFARASGLA